jgi:hypothetical protein
VYDRTSCRATADTPREGDCPSGDIDADECNAWGTYATGVGAWTAGDGVGGDGTVADQDGEDCSCDRRDATEEFVPSLSADGNPVEMPVFAFGTGVGIGGEVVTA